MIESGDNGVESGGGTNGFNPISPREPNTNWEESDTISNADAEKLVVNIGKTKLT